MVRATEPEKNRKLQAARENSSIDNGAKGTKYILISEDEFKAHLEYGLERYKEIWKSLADK